MADIANSEQTFVGPEKDLINTAIHDLSVVLRSNVIAIVTWDAGGEYSLVNPPQHTEMLLEWLEGGAYAMIQSLRKQVTKDKSELRRN